MNVEVIVIGGGPAGMMAAGRAAAAGATVVLLEKNRRVGKKLLITGGGRCNVTNEIGDRHELVARYGGDSKGLHSVFARFSPEMMRTFLRERGLETKVENEGRVFPITNSAASVREVLERFLEEGHVMVRSKSTVRELLVDKARVRGVMLDGGERLKADAVIVATGGVSRPETGSTGDGFRFVSQCGHSVQEPEPSLVPV
ncbi:MAG: aminoacetone oxidase family FAD-binding enzyme, partial [Spirochaetales bacterium]